MYTMTRFVISDHHFEHDNIREYANRPFETLEDMHHVLRSRWESVVDEDDVIVYGGDVAMASGDTAIEWIESLPGSVLYLQGNHDGSLNAESAPFPIVEDTILQYDGYRFWYTHNPENVPEDWTEWVLHGHTHDDDPFINYDTKRVNVSVEVIGYTPVPLPQITKALSSMSNGDTATTIEESPIKHHQWFHQSPLTNVI